jgi:hypothetical protein
MATPPGTSGLRHPTRMPQSADRARPEPKDPSRLAAGAMLVLYGDPRVLPASGQAVVLERRAAALCALAALEPGCTRERASLWLWPDSDDPRRNLRQQVLRFRRGLQLPLLAEGDLLAIMSAGAYGMAMASNYNTRPRAAEVMIDGDQVHLIRRRETVSELFALESPLP